MKRHITDLEKSLIDNGFRLDHKIYGGKHSQFVSGYLYVGVKNIATAFKYHENVAIQVLLDSKRTKVENILVENLYSDPFVDYHTTQSLLELYLQVESIVLKITKPDCCDSEDDEIVEILESENVDNE